MVLADLFSDRRFYIPFLGLLSWEFLGRLGLTAYALITEDTRFGRRVDRFWRFGGGIRRHGINSGGPLLSMVQLIIDFALLYVVYQAYKTIGEKVKGRVGTNGVIVPSDEIEPITGSPMGGGLEKIPPPEYSMA